MDGHRIHLSELLDTAAERRPGHPAVEDEHGRSMTYAALARAADRLATRLARWGVGRGDRVGLFLPRGLGAVAAVHGVLRSGAALVPADPAADVAATRAAAAFADAGVKAVISGAAQADALCGRWTGPGPIPRLISTEPGSASADADWGDILADDAPSPLPPPRSADDLAYVLYDPAADDDRRGVMLSHANAFALLEWSEGAFDLRDDDRFASHASLYSAPSVFDVLVPCSLGATLVLAGEGPGSDPARLGRFLSDRRISVWHATPERLSGLERSGDPGYPRHLAPRLVLSTGKGFPHASLGRLRGHWPDTAVWALYGTVETNACVAMPVTSAVTPRRAGRLPIGRPCPPARARVVDASGRDVPPGLPGELLIAGPGVSPGYFGRPDLTDRAFLDEPGPTGSRWFRTGDVATVDATGFIALAPRGPSGRTTARHGRRVDSGGIDPAAKPVSAALLAIGSS